MVGLYKVGQLGERVAQTLAGEFRVGGGVCQPGGPVRVGTEGAVEYLADRLNKHLSPLPCLRPNNPDELGVLLSWCPPPPLAFALLLPPLLQGSLCS